MTYSPSRLDTYRQCPQKFKFHYIDHLSSPTEGIESFMGSRVHETLERLYCGLRYNKVLSLPEVLADYKQRWESEWHDHVQIIREGLTPDDYLYVGEQCLTDYYHRYAPFNQSRTLGVEYPLRFSLDPSGKYVMQGNVDRLSQPKEDVIWIHDYKAKGFLPTQDTVDADRQLAYYQMGVQQLWPQTKEVVLVWHYLIFDREFHSSRTQASLEALRQETIALIQEIESATTFPPKQSSLCDWCEYRNICPLFRHLYETSTLPKSTYEKEEGVALVNRLAALQAEEVSLGIEMDKVKEALCAYAAQKGVETVFSKTHKARIRTYDNTQFPGRNDNGRQALETLLKREGKWEEVSSLNTVALSKALQNGAWGLELSSEVQKHGTPHKSLWVKVFPLDEGAKEHRF